MRVYHIVGLLILLVFLSAEGCQKETATTITAPVTGPSEQPRLPEVPLGADVKIGRSFFDPITAKIKKGATVTWKNTDIRNHKLQIVGTTIISPTLEPGNTWEQEFDETGKYRIYDIFSKFEGYVEVSE